jgi:undecaprenyl-diphosphatase
MLQMLKQWDIALLRLINGLWSNPLFDAVLPWLRESWFWLPLYVFLLVFSIANFGRKSAWWIAGFIASVSCSDIVSSSVFKPFFERLRPCRDPEVLSFVTLRLEHCSGGFSFTSSHATNHFAMATYVFITLAPWVSARYRWFMYAWAFAVAYAQVYVGVHYPADVIAGALLGTGIGTMVAKYISRYHALQPGLA